MGPLGLSWLDGRIASAPPVSFRNWPYQWQCATAISASGIALDQPRPDQSKPFTSTDWGERPDASQPMTASNGTTLSDSSNLGWPDL